MNESENLQQCFSLCAALIGISIISSACGNKEERPTEDGAPPAPTPAVASPEGSGAAMTKAAPLTVGSVPRPEGSALVMATADTRTIMLRGPMLLEASKSFFESELATLGWQIDSATSEVADGVGFLDFRSGELKLTVTLNPDRDGKTMTYILQGSGVEVAAENGGEPE